MERKLSVIQDCLYLLFVLILFGGVFGAIIYEYFQIQQKGYTCVKGHNMVELTFVGNNTYIPEQTFICDKYTKIK